MNKSALDRETMKTHKCPECNYKTQAKGGLASHSEIHKGDKCEYCELVFTEKRHLKSHMKTKHQQQYNLRRKMEQEQEVAGAVQAWQKKIKQEPDLFRPGLPLALAYTSRSLLLDPCSSLLAAQEVKRRLLLLREEGDQDSSWQLYSLHDPSLTKTSLRQVVARLGRQAAFQLFLASMIYVDCGQEDLIRDEAHFTTKDTPLPRSTMRNPKKTDKITEIHATGFEVYSHNFCPGLNRSQARFLVSLVQQATRLGGHLTNLGGSKWEEKLRGDQEKEKLLLQILGTEVLWEAGRTFGQKQPEVERGHGEFGQLLMCGLCKTQARGKERFKSMDRSKMKLHMKIKHPVGVEQEVRRLLLPSEHELEQLRLGKESSSVVLLDHLLSKAHKPI